jgi:serine/threonine protein kinase
LGKDDGSRDDLRPTEFASPPAEKGDRASGDRGGVKSKTPPPEAPVHSRDDNLPTEFIVPKADADDKPTDGLSPDRSAQAPTLAEGPSAGAESVASSDFDETLSSGEYDPDQPKHIGNYRILETLGEGGMGVVYMAEQTEPVRRRVALKVIKLGMDTKEVVTRFEAERQALAVMDHPNIAKVYDGGATRRGRPYFVMELVRGISILEYCDKQNLGTQERLELFISVCDAIQHAHQKGVIHRDLKPSNILVSSVDGSALSKVIDFGVAKATGASLSQKTMHTQTGQLVGTPEYMSPEQAELSGMDIDTRTDIYSLGVVLYELLTGELPLDGEELRGAGFVEMQRIIQEKEPPRPSIRFTSLGGPRSGEVAKLRATEPRALTRQIKGDLDWIVMKSLEKDRTRRYQTALAFAQDIGRHLANEPIQARPPSTAYRVRKFVRRNRFGVLMAATLTAALVVGMIGTAVGFVRATRETAKAQAVTGFLQNMLSSVDPATAQGQEITVREILDDAATTVGADFGDQPEVEASVRQTIGEMYRNLGHYDEAETHLGRSMDLQQRVFGANSEQALEIRNSVAVNYFRAGRYDDAQAIWTEGIDAIKRVHGEDHVETLTWLQNIAAMHLARERWAEAEPVLKEVLDGRRRVLGEKHIQTLSTLNNLGQLYQETGRYQEAEPLLADVLRDRREILGPDHPRTLNSTYGLGELYLKSGHHDRAEPLIEQARLGFERVLGHDHDRTLMAARTLAEVRLDLGKLRAAESLALETHAAHAARYGVTHEETQEVVALLVRIYEDLGKTEEAETWRERLPVILEDAPLAEPEEG